MTGAGEIGGAEGGAPLSPLALDQITGIFNRELNQLGKSPMGDALTRRLIKASIRYQALAARAESEAVSGPKRTAVHEVEEQCGELMVSLERAATQARELAEKLYTLDAGAAAILGRSLPRTTDISSLAGSVFEAHMAASSSLRLVMDVHNAAMGAVRGESVRWDAISLRRMYEKELIRVFEAASTEPVDVISNVKSAFYRIVDACLKIIGTPAYTDSQLREELNRVIIKHRAEPPAP